jgi:hypothetical protein
MLHEDPRCHLERDLERAREMERAERGTGSEVMQVNRCPEVSLDGTSGRAVELRATDLLADSLSDSDPRLCPIFVDRLRTH